MQGGLSSHCHICEGRVLNCPDILCSLQTEICWSEKLWNYSKWMPLTARQELRFTGSRLYTTFGPNFKCLVTADLRKGWPVHHLWAGVEAPLQHEVRWCQHLKRPDSFEPSKQNVSSRKPWDLKRMWILFSLQTMRRRVRVAENRLKQPEHWKLCTFSSCVSKSGGMKHFYPSTSGCFRDCCQLDEGLMFPEKPTLTFMGFVFQHVKWISAPLEHLLDLL